jgi:hypothetical protein
VSGEPHTRRRYFYSPHYQDIALYPSIAQLERAAGFGARTPPSGSGSPARATRERHHSLFHVSSGSGRNSRRRLMILPETMKTPWPV